MRWGVNSRSIFVLYLLRILHLWLHLCLTLDEVESQLQIELHFCVVPFEDALHIWLQSHLCLTLDEVGGQLSIQIQLQIHICVVSFEGALHLWLQSHLCLTLDHVG